MKDFEEKLQKELDKLPFTKHVDDGQYNDGKITGFELGARWAYSEMKEALRALKVKQSINQE